MHKRALLAVTTNARPRKMLFWLAPLLPVLSPGADAAPIEVMLAPKAIVDQTGGSAGNVASLAVQDQSGTQDNPAKYVLFSTPSTVYQGYRRYVVPKTISPRWIVSLRIRANYFGPAKAGQQWSWQGYDWTRKTWVKIGDNAAAVANQWTTLNFTAMSAARLVNSNGELRLQLLSNNAANNAKLDYEAVTVKYNNPGGPAIAGCPLLPKNNIWNRRVDDLPVHPRSAQWINAIGRYSGFHMDFGSGKWDGGPIGIPYNIVSAKRVKFYNVDFYYPDESDPGPYPIPGQPLIEWGGDHHLLSVDTDHCRLYEIYDASRQNGQWSGGSGAIWNLTSNALRPAGWTSADAAGLPILPGLVAYDEVRFGEIKHALRFTANCTGGYIWPARHKAPSGSCNNPPPMGARFRLKASYDISGFSPPMQVILKAMQTYGIMLSDNGSDWYVSGAPDERWNNDMLHELDVLTGDAFEAVDVSGVMIDVDSGEAIP